MIRREAAGGVADRALAEVVGEHKGLAGNAGDVGEQGEKVADGPSLAAKGTKATEAVYDDEANPVVAGDGEEGSGVAVVVEVEVVEGIGERGKEAAQVEIPGTGALEVEGMAGFAFAPEDVAGWGGEGGAIRPGKMVEVSGGEVEAEKGFAGAGLAGEDGEEAVGEPAGPCPADGGEHAAKAGPGCGRLAVGGWPGLAGGCWLMGAGG